MHSSIVSIIGVATLGVTAAAAAAPGELLATDAPDGFELLIDGSADDLTYDDYVVDHPEALAHLDASSPEARALRGAVNVWSYQDEEFMTAEVIHSLDDAAADAVVAQALAHGRSLGLGPADAPFDGATVVAGPEGDTWQAIAAWRQGPNAIVLTHLATGDVGTDVIREAATLQRDAILSSAGLAVATDAAAPSGSSESGAEGASSGESGGGIGIGTVLVWLVLIGGAIFLFLKLRKKMQALKGQPGGAKRSGRATEPEDDELSTDEIIERARARSRARAEVEEAEWKVPDDY